MQKVILHRRKRGQRLEQLLAKRQPVAVYRHDDIAHDNGELDHRPCRIAPFGKVAVEDRGRRPAVENAGQFPACIGRVPQARVHPLPSKRRREMRGVPRQKDAPLAPAVGHARVKGIDRLADQIPRRQRAKRREQCRDKPVFQRLGVAFAGKQHEFIAPPAIGRGHRHMWPRVGAEEMCVVRRIGIVARVDHDPVLRIGRALHADAKPFAGRTAPAICGDNILCINVATRAIGSGKGDGDMVVLRRHVDHVT